MNSVTIGDLIMRKSRKFVALSTGIITILFINSAMAYPCFLKVFGIGGAVLNTASGFFEGTVDLLIDDEFYLDVPFAVALLAPLVPDEQGILNVEATHTYDFGGGDTITTMDTGFAEPTDTVGIYFLYEEQTIISGTGNFEDVSGTLHALGILDLQALPCADFILLGAMSL
jgi:hypothetical protein